MRRSLKIVIIGNFDFSNNLHHATIMSIEHSARVVGVEVDCYWLRIQEAIQIKESKLIEYDGIWVAPDTYENSIELQQIMHIIMQTSIPLFITGGAFPYFIEEIVATYKLNVLESKVISQNLIKDELLQKIEVEPISHNLKILYGDRPRTELTNSRFSIYPAILGPLSKIVIDIEAVNQYDDPEIVSLKSRPFCVATMCIPQICSSVDTPHPLINAFINFMFQLSRGIQPN